MNVFFENGDSIDGDMLHQWIQRSELAPVPRTLELTVRDSPELRKRLAENELITTGAEDLKYRIVQMVRPQGSGQIQETERAVIRVTAFLDMAHKVAQRLPRAVIQERRTLGEAYRACGGTSATGNDFTVERFSCLKGQIPSFALAVAMQEEAGGMLVRDKRLHFMRLADMAKQEPALKIMAADTSEAVQSELLERLEVPSYFSMDDAGAVVLGDQSTVRGIGYAPRSRTRVLFNLSRALITRYTLSVSLARHLQAGAVVAVDDVPHVVTHALHLFEKGVESEGQIFSYSKLWLGALA